MIPEVKLMDFDFQYKRRNLILESCYISSAIVSIMISILVIFGYKEKKEILNRSNNVSIAIYVIAGLGFYPKSVKQKIELDKNFSMANFYYYCSDTEIVAPSPDLCTNSTMILFESAMGHFESHEIDTGWCFFLNPATYLNTTNLYNYLFQLQKTIDPFKTPHFSFAIQDKKGMPVPDGSSGYLMSNAGLKALREIKIPFRYDLQSQSDEIAVGQSILSQQLNVEDFYNPYFIPKWPEKYKEYLSSSNLVESLPKCPKSLKLFQFQQEVELLNPEKLISTAVPFPGLEGNNYILRNIPNGLRIIPGQNKPTFCRSKN